MLFMFSLRAVSGHCFPVTHKFYVSYFIYNKQYVILCVCLMFVAKIKTNTLVC